MSNVTDYALYMLSPEGIVTNWNAGGERIKGYKASEIVGQNFSKFYSEADRAAGDCMFVCVSRSRGDRLVLDL